MGHVRSVICNEALLPVNGSPAAEQAMLHVFDLAERFGATVHVLFIVNMTRDSAGIVGGTVLDALEREGRRVVGEVETRGKRRGIETHGVVRRGTPYDAALDCVAEHGVEVIMMATHGRTGVERVLPRSVTKRVIRATSVSVSTICTAE